MKKKQKLIAVLAALGIVAMCGMSLPASGSDSFDTCFEEMAEMDGGGINYGSMCAARYTTPGSTRYNDCKDCSKWHMCTPIDIKYCPKRK